MISARRARGGDERVNERRVREDRGCREGAIYREGKQREEWREG